MFRIHWGRMVWTSAIHPAFRRAAPTGVLTAIAVLVFATSALAVSGTPIKIAEPVQPEYPAVAVDGTGTAYIAWANRTDVGGVGDTIEYCTLPVGATGCTHMGTLHAEGGATPAIDQVQVLFDESTVVLLADVYGVGAEYVPEQEWTSTNGGATFNAVGAGKSVAEGILSADTGPLNALIVPGSNALGYAWTSAGGPPTFAEFPFGSSPPQCSVETGHTCPFATLQTKEEAELYPLRNEHGSLASRLGTDPGVLGVYETGGKPGPASPPCTNGTAFVYGSGEQSLTNSYDISPGEPHSAWKVALSPGDCEAQYVAVGGGPSGLGVAEKDQTRGYEVYHQFNQTTDSFEPSTVTIAKETGLNTSVSQDGAGGIYVTYLGNANIAIRLAYSSNGGASWTGPATLNANADVGATALVSSVGSGGQGWAVWRDRESVIAQPFVASDAVPPPVVAPISNPAPPSPNSGYTVESITSNSNGTVTLTFVPTQSGEAALVVTVPTASIASASAEAAKSKRCKHGQIKIKGKCLPATTVTGKTSAKGTAGVPLKLTVDLSSKIKAQLKKGKTVHLTATLTYTSSLGGASTVRTFLVTVKGKHRRHRH
jgi:hypothetical protein